MTANYSNFTNKVFRITDLVKVIGKYKHEFENALDVARLNENVLFQDLIRAIFACQHDSCLFKRNKDEDRIKITICKHNDPIIIVTCFVNAKFKQKPYHVEMFFMSSNILPIHNQRKLSKWILDDSILLSFFK